MNKSLRRDAETIAFRAIEAVKPDKAVRRALEKVNLSGRIFLVAVGKAAWQMAYAAVKQLRVEIHKGIVITKYGHIMGDIPQITCYEAGHPVPDENSFLATQAVLDMTADLLESDTVLFMLSGGGSALFEKPLLDPSVLQKVTKVLLNSGADIRQINIIRKRLSAVKGGKFARHCSPARIEAVILSDIIGDSIDMIASGPAVADSSTIEDAMEIAEQYHLNQYDGVQTLLMNETPKKINNVHTQVIGSVRELCHAAELAASSLGYDSIFLTDRLDGKAADTGRYLAKELISRLSSRRKIALIAGGETVVYVKGIGLGGRNQELVLAASEVLRGNSNAAIISVGSDGTDGPTDAAGGYADGDTVKELEMMGIDVSGYLENNDSYHALQAIGNLIFTGPTGTNVNDLTVCLLDTAECTK